MRHDTCIVFARKAQSNRIAHIGSLTCPARRQNTIAKARFHLRRIGTIVSMNFKAARSRHKTKNRVAINRVTAFGNRIVDVLQVFINNQDIFGSLSRLPRREGAT